MKIQMEIKKAIYSKYQASTLWTVDKVPLYLDHVPASTSFPFIVVHPISSNNTMAMPSPIVSNTTGWDYVDGIWQFAIHSNDRQHQDLEDIVDKLEDLYHRQTLPTANNVTHIATISVDQKTTFWDALLKIWSIYMSFRILAGR